MSQENVEIVRDAFKAWEHEGVDAFFEYLHPEITWALPPTRVNVGEMRGKEAVRLYVQDWIDTFDELSVSPEQLLDVGDDRVVAVQRVRGRAKLSGIETQLLYAVTYEFRDGLAVRVREYATHAEALKAVGLEE